MLERGSPNSTYLNFAVFFVSIAVSFLTALFTGEIQSRLVFDVFVILAAVGLCGGAVLLVLWYRTRSSVNELLKKIKARVPSSSPGTSEPGAEPARPGQTESPSPS
jgi:hypothetical protein